VKKRKAFTLIELLVVVAIIALLIAILLPSLSRARELAKRTNCVANEKGIGTAIKIYANENADWYPHHYYNPKYAAPASTNQTHEIQWVTTMGSKGGIEIKTQTMSTGITNIGHPSRSSFLLIINGQSTTGQFICPSSGDQEDDLRNRGSDASQPPESAAQPGINRFDFRGYPYMSYGYQMPFARRGKPKEGMDQRMPIGADKGPFFTVGNADANTQTTADAPLSGNNSPTTTQFGSTTDVILKASTEKWRSYNSQNHNGEGQNVLYSDGHAEWQRKPIVGVNNDNIYTVQQDYTNAVGILLGRDPAESDGNASKYGPLTNTDACIVP
jgi:prepilin-type N-terminal cleavage/methylation domain-containing protein